MPNHVSSVVPADVVLAADGRQECHQEARLQKVEEEIEKLEKSTKDLEDFKAKITKCLSAIAGYGAGINGFSKASGLQPQQK